MGVRPEPILLSEGGLSPGQSQALKVFGPGILTTAREFFLRETGAPGCQTNVVLDRNVYCYGLRLGGFKQLCPLKGKGWLAVREIGFGFLMESGTEQTNMSLRQAVRKDLEGQL